MKNIRKSSSKKGTEQIDSSKTSPSTWVHIRPHDPTKFPHSSEIPWGRERKNTWNIDGYISSFFSLCLNSDILSAIQNFWAVTCYECQTVWAGCLWDLVTVNETGFPSHRSVKYHSAFWKSDEIKHTAIWPLQGTSFPIYPLSNLKPLHYSSAF